MFKVGKILNYYGKTTISIVELDGTLSVGDRIIFSRDGNTLFEQVVELIQIGHEKVDSVDRGNMIGLKTNEEVQKGDEIYKI
ncbi:MAG TPA: translation elongation factor-like protein [Patescibacteria group bacterium]|nr:translation elongation factor-like protein [Patescibacteria group bacterium]